MVYQIGVLIGIVIAAVVLISSVIIGVSQGKFEFAVGAIVVAGVFVWLLELPYSLLGRIGLLFREGVPLAPYGFRRNATLGYWLGIPFLYFGHLITIGTLYVIWEMLKQPTDGVPVGIGFAFAIMAYSVGIGMVESSYRLWAKDLNGVTPGDAGSSPLKSVLSIISILSVVVVVLYISNNSTAGRSEKSAVTQESPATAEDRPLISARIELADFIALTDGEWPGELKYRDDEQRRFVKFDATLQAALTGGDTVSLAIEFPGAARKPEVLRFQLNEEGRRINDLDVVERSELPFGELGFAAYGNGFDNNNRAKVRMTFLIGEGSLKLQKHIEQATGSYILRSEYNFARPGSAD